MHSLLLCLCGLMSTSATSKCDKNSKGLQSILDWLRQKQSKYGFLHAKICDYDTSGSTSESMAAASASVSERSHVVTGDSRSSSFRRISRRIVIFRDSSLPRIEEALPEMHAFEKSNPGLSPLVATLKREPFSREVYRINVRLPDHSTKLSLEGQSVYSLVFDTSCEMSMIVPGEHYNPKPELQRGGITGKGFHVGNRVDVNFFGNTVTESIAFRTIGARGSPNTAYMYSSQLAIVIPDAGSLVGDGVLAANRNSAFVEEVGSFIIVPDRNQKHNNRAGYLVFGDARLAPYCKSADYSPVNLNLLPNRGGEWVVEGTVSIGEYVTAQPVTFLVQSTIEDIVLSDDLFATYMDLLQKRLNLDVEIYGILIVIHKCEQQFEEKGISQLPSITATLGSPSATISVEIPFHEFTIKNKKGDRCRLALRSAKDIGLQRNEAVLGAKFLNSVAVQFSHRINTLSICPHN